MRLTGPQALGRFLDERARLGRLVLAGPSPIEVPQALLLGPGRLDVDDLLLALDRLAAPIQLVILGELEGRDGARREAALVQLAERLPEGVEAVVIELDRPQGGRGKVSQPS